MINEKLGRINELMNELFEVTSFYSCLLSKWKKLSKKYESKELTYEEFKLEESKLLGGKSIREIRQEQSIYAYTLVKQMIIFLDSLIADVYEDNLKLIIPKPVEAKKPLAKENKLKKAPIEEGKKEAQKEVEAKHPEKVEAKNVGSLKKPTSEEVKPQIKREVVKRRIVEGRIKVEQGVEQSKRVNIKKEEVVPAQIEGMKTHSFFYNLFHRTKLNLALEPVKKVRVGKGEVVFKQEKSVFNLEGKEGRSHVKTAVPEQTISEKHVEQKKIDFSKLTVERRIESPVKPKIRKVPLTQKGGVKVKPVNILPKKVNAKKKFVPEKAFSGVKKTMSVIEEKKEFYKFEKGKNLKREGVKSTRKNELNKSSINENLNAFSVFLKKLHSKPTIRKLRIKNEKLVSNKNVVPVAVELLKAREEKRKILTPALKVEVEEISKVAVPVRKYKSYTTSTISSLSNLMVRGLSTHLLSAYPDFFRNFYKKLRSAEIPLLSNTYINIMLFFMILSSLFSFVISFVIFLVVSSSFLVSLAKSLLVSLIASTLVFLVFYYYPSSLISEKRKNLRKNLPFAINQMAAVASADLPPLTIFKIVAKNEEYGEVSKELARIVNYVEVFGIDFLVAVKSVASLTPDEFFKDLLQGTILTINSGEKLEGYLKQKADEALNMYKLEIEKYNSTVSTLSDIYTAVLIAAPLLMVASMSLMQLIGGSFGGLSVGALMALGTYVAIPALNLLFILVVKMIRSSV